MPPTASLRAPLPFDGAQVARLRHEALGSALLWGMLALGLGALSDGSVWVMLKSLALFAGATALVWRALPAHPHRHFGLANQVTLARLMLIALLASTLGEPALHAQGWAWGVAGLAALAASLDALDGPLARAGGQASEFGARFDMETDALLVLVLSLLVAHVDKAGAWVVLSGLLRYLFVAASWAWPWLARPLAPSLRRKAVCVLQIALLIACLVPVVSPTLGAWLAGAGLLMLVASFASDGLWLWRARRRAGKETA